MNTTLFRAIIAIAVVVPLSYASAATFVAPEGESASVRQEVTGDVYAASNAVVIAAPVHGDIFAAGDSVDISGQSDASVFAIGRSITVSGDAKDDIRVVGSMVSLTAATAHDVFAAGSSVFLGPESSAGGDAYLAGSDITVAGTIRGSLRIAGEKVTIAKTAIITGDLITYGNDPIIEDGATIGGKTTTIAAAAHPQKERRQNVFGHLIRSAASAALLAYALILLAPLFMAAMYARANTSPVHSGLIGLGILLLFFPLAVILAITGIGFQLAALVGTTTLFLIMIGMGTSTVLLGAWSMKLVTKKDNLLTWQHAVIGGVAATLISLMGGIGFIVLFIIFLIGLGVAAHTLKHIIYGK
ncbi:MAG: hypothetical protein A3C02_00300 [Candidatus Andersenbacteria bacterium RIFCSPHIGHO2_02_FULL_45_11]|uniref:DUF8173 domain-containing protein n=1 Tax=Candidatus Andersenbacteria bacterium RIFCSPHIGHO2_12_FULL_45_11 TaxID=1797281 RepID=A0A1G1X2E4_9BACT|nr:MAG: hypothetical protein A2805_02210 [Candidatus Andersenbacteria bacterium RIFCSPHIGHO2_01_FULL_46_36]OGY33971.1 MAG: hypothetical protein A3D99_04100 [Candidatus Andersenbacteria bacterium RIFCSPHIGHO2_12_FULL_45_11]OGY34538.1 MAG: hypothetical protein A3C02_00300 [Candidatus Andersenbacteria bacterium RIFCSPHIGHO2_02_FULL_45_11]